MKDEYVLKIICRSCFTGFIGIYYILFWPKFWGIYLQNIFMDINSTNINDINYYDIKVFAISNSTRYKWSFFLYFQSLNVTYFDQWK